MQVAFLIEYNKLPKDRRASQKIKFCDTNSGKSSVGGNSIWWLICYTSSTVF